MGKVVWRLAIAAMVAAGVVVGPASPTTVWACSCGSLTDAEYAAMADVVFVGRFDERRDSNDLEFASDAPARFIFTVQSVYKGEAFEQQSVVTASSGASCGLEIGPGTTALVYARTGGRSGLADGELTSDLCTGTRAIAADALPASFGEASPPRAGTSGIGDGNPLVPSLSDLVRGGVIGAIVITALVLLAVGLIRGRHARRSSPPA